MRLLVFLLLFMALPSFAVDGQLELLNVSPDGDGERYSVNIETLIMMTLLSFLSAAIIMLTPFLRCIIVFGLLRQAIGAMTAPPNKVLVAISLLISYIVMQPTLDKLYVDIYKPYKSEQISYEIAENAALEEMKKFWLSSTSDEELLYFSELFEVAPVAELMDLPLKVVIPAFVYSELKIAFKIGFLLFIPFLIIDMVIASILMGMGMMMLSPQIVSLPFKIFAFVILDGWGLLTTSLIASYGVL